MQAVTVIVPTQAMPERHALFKRAIESVLSQDGVRVVPLVVINGTNQDPVLVREIMADGRLRTATSAPGLATALVVGRELVDTPFFAELDDDDIYLPGALSARLRALETLDVDTVISNGLRRNAGGDVLHIPDTTAVARDPLRALCRANWLLPGSWLCRTDRVEPWLMRGMPAHLECTWLAVRFATRTRIHILERPTVVWHTDTPCAVTRTSEYVLGQVPGLKRILELELPPDVRDEFRRRLAPACHMIAELYLRSGRRGQAWRWHLRSLVEPGGASFLPFTVRMLAPVSGT
jgi:hypothetical protein